MTPTRQLFVIADAQGIAVEFYPLPRPLLGHYFAEPGMRPVITLSPELERHEALFRCVLAEELGHHFTSVGDMLFRPYQSYMGRVLLSKQEKLALKWAANLLMPPMEVIPALCSGESIINLAECFFLTPTFVRAVFQLPMYTRLLTSISGEATAVS